MVYNANCLKKLLTGWSGDSLWARTICGPFKLLITAVTRFRTPRNEEVAMSDATVISDHILNFSAQAKEAAMLLRTTVTIGYELPWPKMHEPLPEAARKPVPSGA